MMIKQLSGLKLRQQSIAWALLVVVMIVYALEMSHQAVLRYDTFKATAFDLGNMDQVIWNTLHGRFFQFTNEALDWYGPPTRLAVHFEPIILPLSLLYAFHADPRILLVFQTLALASGALPVFLLTRHFLPRWPIMAALMATAYLLMPALLGLNIFDFHPYSLATPFLLYAMLALTYRRYGWFLLACVLAAATKEDVPLTVAMLGVLVIWKYKLPRLGTVLILGGILWSALAFGVIIPHFYPGAQHNNFWYRYEQLGNTPATAIINLALHPWLLFTTFITLDRVYYVAGLLRSTGFLALLAPEWLLAALPSLAVNLLSTDPTTYSGVYHYNATIIPFVMIAAIHGTRRLILLWQHWRGESGMQQDAPALQIAATGSTARRGQAPAFYLHMEANVKADLLRRAQRIGQSHTWSIFQARLSRLRQGVQQSKVWPVLLIPTRWVTRTIPTTRQWASEQWQRLSERIIPIAKRVAVARLQWLAFAWITLMIGLNFAIATPELNIFWTDHEPGTREQLIGQLLAIIPPDASVSASDNLNPHLTERQYATVFPIICTTYPTCTEATTVQYIVVDLDSIFPDERGSTVAVLNQLRNSGQYREVKAAEGVVLLVRRSA